MTRSTQQPTHGNIGIAHTRWATHGVPSERNAHPHISRDGLAIVHNGIIENHDELRAELEKRRLHSSPPRPTPKSSRTASTSTCRRVKDLFKAVRATVAELEGAYALAVVSEHDPERLILAREGCPVVVGLGVGRELRRLGRRGAAAGHAPLHLPRGRRRRRGAPHARCASSTATATPSSARCARASCRPMPPRRASTAHFMLKEIHEQPRAIADTLQERVANGRLLEAAFGPAATEVFKRTAARAHRRLRHELPRRRRGALLHRADLQAAVRRRHRQRVPLPQSRWCRRIRCS